MIIKWATELKQTDRVTSQIKACVVFPFQILRSTARFNSDNSILASTLTDAKSFKDLSITTNHT